MLIIRPIFTKVCHDQICGYKHTEREHDENRNGQF